MSFDEEREYDPYGGMPFSKKMFLEVVAAGGCLTGYWLGVEVPYAGVHAHGAELAADGLVTRHVSVIVAGALEWRPTEAGKIVGRAP